MISSLPIVAFVSMAAGMAWAAAATAAPSTQPSATTRPAVEAVVYVTQTVLEGGPRGPFPIVLEVINHSDQAIEVDDYPRIQMVWENDVPPVSPLAELPRTPDGKPLRLVAYVWSVYPMWTEGIGVELRERVRSHWTLCRPGQSVLIKLNLHGQLFRHPGDCRLLVSLVGPAADVEGQVVARAPAVPLRIIPPAQR